MPVGLPRLIKVGNGYDEGVWNGQRYAQGLLTTIKTSLTSLPREAIKPSPFDLHLPRGLELGWVYNPIQGRYNARGPASWLFYFITSIIAGKILGVIRQLSHLLPMTVQYYEIHKLQSEDFPLLSVKHKSLKHEMMTCWSNYGAFHNKINRCLQM